MLHLADAADEHGRLRAIDLVAALRRANQPARLRLVGPVPPAQRGRLLAHAVAGGVAAVLDLAGERAQHEVARLLVASALLVVPPPAAASGQDGAAADGRALLPVVLAGCCAGTPVLAADLPAIRAAAAELTGVTLLPPDAPADAWRRAATHLLPIPPT
ncbi:MAG: glycosyltransferase, partial [Frankia sp.]|nr:glycosyltransferase [Frankia sp.]